ncbi:MAG: NAD(P)/FAD-dependent oxidoreductase [Bdellovibrionales bacterium]|nr:NAD(P)/FAD-dependent oxidoreductase [Bdellovibrionales bacterium]
MSKSNKIVIVGGGTAGISVLNGLKRRLGAKNLVLIEPGENHFYQPWWTLVGAGEVSPDDSKKPMKDLIPDGCQWIKEKVSTFSPEENIVITESGTKVDYDWLIVTAGLQIDWHKVKGLPENMWKNGVCSNYDYQGAQSTWELTKNFKGGKALFTQPNTPIKCAGAPQKVMYQSEEHFRKNGIRSQSEVYFTTASAGMFGVEKYKLALEKIVASRDIKPVLQHNLVEIDGNNKKAFFEKLDSGERVEMDYDMIHVVPPMSAPDFIKASPIANAEGWVDIHKHTLQHNKYSNIFSLGDAGSTPNSKTGAAVRSQGPVVIQNLLSAIEKKPLLAKYQGYASCPLITGKNKCILAEFGYDGKIMETFPFDQAVERRSMYLLKRYVIPFLYWNAMVKGYF